jgi:hypothetical protein
MILKMPVLFYRENNIKNNRVSTNESCLNHVSTNESRKMEMNLSKNDGCPLALDIGDEINEITAGMSWDMRECNQHFFGVQKLTIRKKQLPYGKLTVCY